MQNSITELLSTLLREALGKAGLPVPDDVLWEMPREESHGDYATNVALALARPARKAPREIAEAIRKNFPVSPMVSTLEVAGPGFLNVSLAADWCAGALKEILAAGARYGTTMSAPRRRVLLEFVSANPTGPLVIVNARGARGRARGAPRAQGRGQHGGGAAAGARILWHALRELDARAGPRAGCRSSRAGHRRPHRRRPYLRAGRRSLVPLHRLRRRQGPRAEEVRR